MGGIFAAGIPIGRTFKLVETLFRRQFGRYRLGDDCGCLGTVDDASRAGFILRRYGAEKKPALDDDAQLFHRDIRWASFGSPSAILWRSRREMPLSAVWGAYF